MHNKPVVIVISDLHMGGGESDPGDDHVFDDHQLQRFILELLASSDGQAGRIELYINGDGFEFAQVRPDVYALGSARAWCSEAESLAKLTSILDGHAEVFAALREFSARGNVITLAAGNHDVDLFWSGVRARLREAAGDLEFVLGEEWSVRFDGRLRIAHGHQYDRANRFQNWSDPFVDFQGERRLEMCPGTLFMVKFVNALEDKYPFADNIKPITALGKILWREKMFGWLAFMLLRFAVRHPIVAMGKDTLPADERLPRMLVEHMACDGKLANTVREWYRKFVRADASDGEIKAALLEPDQLEDFLMCVMAEVDLENWQSVLNPVLKDQTTLGASDGTLKIVAQGLVDENERYREVAKAQWRDAGAQVVVLGHTHCPDELRSEDGKLYFNPGSWTHYVETDKQAELKMEDLKNKMSYPYSLRYVRVVLRADGSLDAVMEKFEEKPRPA